MTSTTTSHTDYYQQLSLPPIPPCTPTSPRFHNKFKEHTTEQEFQAIVDQIDCTDIQEKLKTAMDNIVQSWSDRHDKLINDLNTLEHSRKKLENKLMSQTQLYERSVREAQFYKLRYENFMQQPPRKINQRRSSTALVSSSASCLSGKSFSSSARSSSCASSIRTSTLSLVDELVDPALFYDQHVMLNDSDDEGNGELDLYSIMSNSESFTLPNSPIITPLMSPLSMKPPSSVEDNEIAVTLNDTSNSNSNSNKSDTKSAGPLSTLNARQEEALKDTTMLQFACGEGFWNTIAHGKLNKAEVEALVSNYLRRGGNPNVAKISDTAKSVKEGYGLIHAIIAIKNTAALHKILNAGVNINACPLTSKREDQIPPLILAAKLGYMNGMKLLLEQGGVPLLLNSRGPYGESALHAAVQSGSDEMVGYVLRVSQNSLLEKIDNNGATALHYACITGKTRIITLFVRDCGGRPDPRDNKGETPLHYAVRNRKLKVIARLVRDLGACPNPYILKQVPTPLDLAKSGGFKNIVEFLKSVGGKTTKEMEKAIRSGAITAAATMVHSSNSSVISGESAGSGDSTMSPPVSGGLGVRQYLHTKTSQILRGTFDL